MIWKRIVIVGGMAFAMLIGFMMIIFWACGIAQAKGETALLLYPFLGLLCFIGFLSGWLQPQTDDPWRAGLMLSPGTWVGLLILRNDSMLPGEWWIAPTTFAVTWLSCASAMALRNKRRDSVSESGRREGLPPGSHTT